jgi:sigma-54 interacting transcriptional regulator
MVGRLFGFALLLLVLGAIALRPVPLNAQLTAHSTHQLNRILFLDEIGEVPLAMQAKLLRVLQEQVLERIGDTHTRKVNARLIAATDRDLTKELDAGRFRQDLFYRLRVIRSRLLGCASALRTSSRLAPILSGRAPGARIVPSRYLPPRHWLSSLPTTGPATCVTFRT